MAEERARILKMLAEGRVKAEEAAEMLDALGPAEASGIAASAAETTSEGPAAESKDILELLSADRIDAEQAIRLLNALHARPAAPTHTLALAAPGVAGDGSGRHLRLKWHDASGQLIEQVDVAAPLDDVESLREMLPGKGLDLLHQQGLDLKRLAAQGRRLPVGTVLYDYDNDNAQGIRVTVEGSGPPRPVPAGDGDPARGRRLRLKWEDGSGEEVDVLARLDEALSLDDLLPEPAVHLLRGKGVDLARLVADAERLAAGTVLFGYEDGQGRSVRVTVEA